MAFTFCSSLDNIILPMSIEKVEDYAFTDCANLKHFKVNSEIDNLSKIVDLEKLS